MSKIYEGFHEEADLPVKRGDRVRVRKGAKLISTHPKKGGEYEAYRSQVVTVHHIMPGQSYDGILTESQRGWLETKGFSEQLAEMDRLRTEDQAAWNDYRIHTKNPRVVWAGTGGYWIEADINDVELAEEEKTDGDETS